MPVADGKHDADMGRSVPLESLTAVPHGGPPSSSTQAPFQNGISRCLTTGPGIKKTSGQLQSGATLAVNGQRRMEIVRACAKPIIQLTAPAAEWCNLTYEEHRR